MKTRVFVKAVLEALGAEWRKLQVCENGRTRTIKVLARKAAKR